MKKLCLVSVFALLVAPLYATDDVKVKLTNTTGTSNFAIQDSTPATVASISSKGNIVSGNSGSQAGAVTIWDGSGKTCTVTAAGISADYTLTLPTSAGSSNLVLRTDGTGVLTWGPGVSAVKKTSDQTMASTTLAEDTELKFPVKSGIYYQFEFKVAYTSSATASGLKLSVTNFSSTIFSAIAHIPAIADDEAAFWHGAITYAGDPVTGSGTPALVNVFLATVEGVLLPSADGTLQLQFASETGASMTMKRGSCGMLWTIP